MAKGLTRSGARPSQKATFYEIEFKNGKFYACSDLLTGELLGFGAPFEMKERYDIGGWTVRLMSDRQKINVVYRPTQFSMPILNKTFDLRRSSLCLYAGAYDRIHVFYDLADYEQMLNDFGINEKVMCDKLQTNYTGEWFGEALVSETAPEQKKFWAFSDNREARCMLDYHYVEGAGVQPYPLRSPFDSCLAGYEGEISYRPTNATWVLTCQLTRTDNRTSSTVALHLSPEADLEEIVTWIEGYLSRTGYTRLIDCFSVIPLQQ